MHNFSIFFHFVQFCTFWIIGWEMYYERKTQLWKIHVARAKRYFETVKYLNGKEEYHYIHTIIKMISLPSSRRSSSAISHWRWNLSLWIRKVNALSPTTVLKIGSSLIFSFNNATRGAGKCRILDFWPTVTHTVIGFDTFSIDTRLLYKT